MITPAESRVTWVGWPGASGSSTDRKSAPTRRTPRSTIHAAPAGDRATYSSGKVSRRSGQRAELSVFISTRPVPAGRCRASRSGGPMGPGRPVRSTTVAGPTSTSSGSWSTVAPPSRKWAGGSTWVPVWELSRTSDTLAASPSARRKKGVTATGGSPGHDSRPVRTGSVMSIRVATGPQLNPNRLSDSRRLRYRRRNAWGLNHDRALPLPHRPASPSRRRQREEIPMRNVKVLGATAAAALAISLVPATATQAVSGPRSTFIVELAVPPLASYGEGVSILSTLPEAARSYTDFVAGRQHQVLRRAAATAAPVTYGYRVAFPGFAARLTRAEAARLAADPGVRAVTRDGVSHPTAAPPDDGGGTSGGPL